MRLPENIELKVREVFDMMNLSGNKKVNENEFVKFFAKAGNGPEGHKLCRFMSSKKEVNLDEFREFWVNELKQCQSETILDDTLTQMISARTPSEMDATNILDRYKTQQSLRGSIKTNEIKSRLKASVSDENYTSLGSEEEDEVRKFSAITMNQVLPQCSNEYDPSRESQNMML